MVLRTVKVHVGVIYFHSGVPRVYVLPHGLLEHEVDQCGSLLEGCVGWTRMLPTVISGVSRRASVCR